MLGRSVEPCDDSCVCSGDDSWVCGVLRILNSSSSAKAGDPARRGFTAQSQLPLEYWVARSSRATTAVCSGDDSCVCGLVRILNWSSSAKRGDPVRRGLTAQSQLPLEYWDARPSQAMTASQGTSLPASYAP